MSESTTPEPPVPNYFGPSNGGDLTLRSTDGVDFHVHTIILKIASPILADMLNLGTQRTVVNVGETSEILELMLSFIYPCDAPIIPSFEILAQAFHVADKYQLSGMKSYLQKELSFNGSPVSAYSDPLRAYAIALSQGLTNETTLASSLISQKYDLQDVKGLIEVSKAIPSSTPIVKLVGRPSARARILAEVFFRFHVAPMSFYLDDIYRDILCFPCSSRFRNYVQYSCPEWQARWAYCAFQELATRQLSECGHVFKVEFLKRAMFGDSNPVSKEGCKCQTQLICHSSTLEQWAASVRLHLEAKLMDLYQLDSLV